MKILLNIIIILLSSCLLFACKQNFFLKKDVSSVNVNEIEVKKNKFPIEGFILIKEGDTV